jgi:flavin reductase (DIM6/NTAB) family NADH-FMN oxidoreductase RutF
VGVTPDEHAPSALIEWTMSEITGRRDAARQERAAAEESLLPDAHGARWLRRQLAGGVAVLTTAVSEEYRGATVTACTFVSSEPLLLLVAFELESQMLGWIEESRCFAVNLMPWREQFLADQFAGFAPRASRTFGGIDFEVGETGCPVLSGSIAWVDCRLQESLATGDHRCLIGRAVAIGNGRGNPDDPLVYYRNRYRRFS